MSESRLYNHTVTVYNRISDGNFVTSVRCVVRNCHWEENSIMVYRQTGVTTANQINVIFPRYNKDGQENPVQLRNVEFNLLPVDDLSIFRDNYSIFIGMSQTILVCGEIDLDYPGGWVTSATLTTWENQNFTTGAVRVAEGRRPVDVNYNWFGDKRLHHIITR